jgi:type I restriction enzyme S subunit
MVRLSDLVSDGSVLINDGYRTKSDELGLPGIPILRVGEVQDGHLVPTFGDHVREEFRGKIGAKTSQRGDVVVTTKGTVGRIALVKVTDPEFVYSPQVCFVRVLDSQRVNPDFIYQWFRGSEFTEQALAIQSQTDMAPYINLADFRSLRVSLPSLVEQRAIADVLGALDDKIESNRRLSKTGTELCDQMFLSASDVESQISEAGQVTMGSSPPGDTYNTDGVGMPFYQGVTDFGFLSPTRRVWTTSPIREAKVGETLVSVRAPVGRLNEASEQCCIGRGVAAISSNFPTTFFYALRQADAVWAQFEGEGTVFGSINKGDLEGARIPWISTDRISELETELKDIQQSIRVSIREIESLTSLRDVLLPELLSGRLRVKDAESIMECV